MNTSLTRTSPSLYAVIATLAISIFSTEALAVTTVIASIEPHKRVILSAEVSGVVRSTSAEIGDVIKDGDPLGRLVADDYALTVQLAQAVIGLSEAELIASENQFNRLNQLYVNKSVSTSQHEKQKSVLEISKSQLLVNKIKYWMAKSDLEKTQIKAPFSGVISARYIEQGQLLNVGDPVYEMVAMDKVKVVFYLLETDLNKLKNIDEVMITVPAINTHLTPATIKHIAPAESGSRAGYRVEAILDNAARLIKPGFTARVIIPEQDQLILKDSVLTNNHSGG